MYSRELDLIKNNSGSTSSSNGISSSSNDF